MPERTRSIRIRVSDLEYERAAKLAGEDLTSISELYRTLVDAETIRREERDLVREDVRRRREEKEREEEYKNARAMYQTHSDFVKEQQKKR